MQSLAQRPAQANTNRERRPRYQHPKGAPNADLIFKTGGRWDMIPDLRPTRLGPMILLCIKSASLWKEQGMNGETDKRDKTGKTSKRETIDETWSRLEQLGWNTSQKWGFGKQSRSLGSSYSDFYFEHIPVFTYWEHIKIKTLMLCWNKGCLEFVLWHFVRLSCL